MAKPNTAKSSELQIMIWFLEAGWEIFAPVADLNATDMVVKYPKDSRLLSIRVKHKQPGSKNEGQLANPWNKGDAPFDYLVFFQPEKGRGGILPKLKLKKEGRMFLFFKKDKNGYPTGALRPIYGSFGFDFSNVPYEKRSASFVDLFSKIHETAVTPAI
jgi:hypothetical protein